MRRITVDEVKAAYEKTGLKPVREMWVGWQGQQCCACGISAMAIAQGHNPMEIGERLSKTYALSEMLDLPIGYIGGFADGFDGHLCVDPMDRQAYATGYQDGLAAAAAIFGEVPA